MHPDVGREQGPLIQILEDLEDYLRYRQAEGRHLAPRAPATAAPTADRRPAAATDNGNDPARRPAREDRTAGNIADESTLDSIAARVAACRRCPLHQSRTQTVPGEGSARSGLVFVGEGPGAVEDRTGRPFVGPAGTILDRLLKRMGIPREDVWIGNMVKCRATYEFKMIKDRRPEPAEMAACMPYLLEQLQVLQPRVIVALGGTALEGLLGLKGITRHRGQWQVFAGFDVMPTFHPSYLLQSGKSKQAFWDVWEDMTRVLERLGRPVPGA